MSDKIVSSKPSTELYCPHCGAEHVVKNGTKYGKQRYVCRECRRTFQIEEDERFKYTTEKRQKVLDAYLEGVGIRSIERLEKVSEPLILKWIKKFGKEVKKRIESNTESKEENKLKESIQMMEIDELCTYIKKNRKVVENILGYGLAQIETKTAS
jgi:transposase